MLEIEVEDEVEESSDQKTQEKVETTSETPIGNASQITSTTTDCQFENRSRIQIGENYYEKYLATPAVRGLARTLGVDLKLVKGSGKRDRILKEDVHNYKEGKQTQEVGKTVIHNAPVQDTANTVMVEKRVESLIPQSPIGQAGVEIVTMGMMEKGMVKSMNYATSVPQF